MVQGTQRKSLFSCVAVMPLLNWVKFKKENELIYRCFSIIVLSRTKKLFPDKTLKKEEVREWVDLKTDQASGWWRPRWLNVTADCRPAQTWAGRLCCTRADEEWNDLIFKERFKNFTCYCSCWMLQKTAETTCTEKETAAKQSKYNI